MKIITTISFTKALHKINQWTTISFNILKIIINFASKKTIIILHK